VSAGLPPSSGPGAGIECGALGAALAQALAARAKQPARELLQRSVELLCRERDQGHVCLPLGDWAGQLATPEVPPLPAQSPWREGLLASGLVTTASALDQHAAPQPLVLDGSDRLYLLRDYRSERSILQAIAQRLQAPPRWPAAAVQQALLELGLLPVRDAAQHSQLVAVTILLQHAFGVLTGGPGTGKTTTIALLLQVLQQLQPDLRIALAAPTGKAAARMAEALRARGLDETRLSSPPTTLHRLLRYHPGEDRCRADASNPLPVDLVLVDEASMVEPALLAALFEALRPTARLLLVGDRDQLAAVGTGQVLGDLCRAARPEAGPGTDACAYASAVLGTAPAAQAGAPPIANAVAFLHYSHRFGHLPGIGGFATAMARRQPDAALQCLHQGHRDLQPCATAEAALAALQPLLHELVAADGPDAALASLSRLRVLTATRHGPMGSTAWNLRIEAALARLGHPVRERHYPLQPILITSNDPDTQLWNGDLGVVFPDAQGRMQVLFPRADGSCRSLRPSRLPPHETAWAMTVHKSQGSEFDTVLLAMPGEDGPLWQAALLYTGITRARQQALLLAESTLLAAALRRFPQRSSGLAEGLGAAETDAPTR
jgi:exodeoxyribonuclease V alpha subunit